MTPVGKTVARIEESPTRQGGYQSDDTVLIHFTDGTALSIAGSSYEEVSQSVRPLDSSEVREWAAAAQGRRERDRLRRLKRAEHLAASCDERARRRQARRAATKDALIPGVLEDLLVTDMMLDAARWSGGLYIEKADLDKTIKGPCERCGERQCENAPDIPVWGPARRSDSPFFAAGTIKIPVRGSDA